MSIVHIAFLVEIVEELRGEGALARAPLTPVGCHWICPHKERGWLCQAFGSADSALQCWNAPSNPHGKTPTWLALSRGVGSFMSTMPTPALSIQVPNSSSKILANRFKSSYLLGRPMAYSDRLWLSIKKEPSSWVEWPWRCWGGRATSRMTRQHEWPKYMSIFVYNYHNY